MPSHSRVTYTLHNPTSRPNAAHMRVLTCRALLEPWRQPMSRHLSRTSLHPHPAEKRGSRVVFNWRNQRQPPPTPPRAAAQADAQPEQPEHERPTEHCKRQPPHHRRQLVKTIFCAGEHGAAEVAEDRKPRAHCKRDVDAVGQVCLKLPDSPDAPELLVEAPRVAVTVLADVSTWPFGDDGEERSGRRLALDVHHGLCRTERLEHLLIGHHAIEHRLAALHAELAS
eukprot:scaffold13687_cov63-Phaeocystis_antarctica.AAC.2